MLYFPENGRTVMPLNGGEGTEGRRSPVAERKSSVRFNEYRIGNYPLFLIQLKGIALIKGLKINALLRGFLGFVFFIKSLAGFRACSLAILPAWPARS